MDHSIDGASRAIGGVEPLPCLNSNISTETPLEGVKIPVLSTQQRKSAFVLKESVSALAERFGVQRLGFLTLTFRDHITHHQEASRRLNSLITHVIKPRYLEYLGCVERQKSGRIHYHLLVVLPWDIRTGVDFKEFENRVYKSAPKTLRDEWAFWRATSPLYGFGRTELMPVKTSIEAMAKYVGKYIAKHTENRLLSDKGARLVRYSKGARVGTTRFQFHSAGSAEWRRKIAIFADLVSQSFPDQPPVKCISDLSDRLGKRWAYRWRDKILNDIP